MSLMSYDAALAILLKDLPVQSIEEVGLLEARTRVLAEPIIAPRSQPPEALSAMDGYSVIASDVAQVGARLDVVGEAPAGGRYNGTVKAGQAVRIFTGAPVPTGADAVIIQENVSRDGDVIIVSDPLSATRNVRLAGIDFAKGDVLLSAGDQLTAERLALAAAANVSKLTVARKPKVAVFSSGNELVEPGGVLQPGTIVNSGSYAVAALAETWGTDVRVCPILPDNVEGTIAAIEPYLETVDVMVTIGGASVGKYDIVKPAFAKMGAQFQFEKAAIKPGKPIWHARFKNGPLIVGLPGNPASAFVCGHLFLKPLLTSLVGIAYRPSNAKARLVSNVPPNGPRETFLRARTDLINGVLNVAIDDRQDSSLLTPFNYSNVLIRRRPNAPPGKPGDMTDIITLHSLEP